MYEISEYTINRAKEYDFIVKVSTRKNKKLDVYKNGVLLGSKGNLLYSDYPSYIKTHGIEFADKRKKLYHLRHKKDIAVVNSLGWIAGILLW